MAETAPLADTLLFFYVLRKMQLRGDQRIFSH